MRFIWTGRIAREIYHLPQNLSSLYCCLGVAHCRNYFAHCTCQLWGSCDNCVIRFELVGVDLGEVGATMSWSSRLINSTTSRTSWVDVWKDSKPPWRNLLTSPFNSRGNFFIHCRRWQYFYMQIVIIRSKFTLCEKFYDLFSHPHARTPPRNERTSVCV